MMVEQGIEFANAARVGEWIGCSPAEVPTRLRGARQAQEMVCVTRQGWVPAVGGRIHPQAFMEPMMRHFGHCYYLAGLSAGGPSRRFASSAAGGPFRHQRPPQQPNHSRHGAHQDVPQPRCRRVPDGLQQTRSWNGHLQPITVSTAEVAVFDLFALHPFRGCDAKETVACELLDPGPASPAGA